MATAGEHRSGAVGSRVASKPCSSTQTPRYGPAGYSGTCHPGGTWLRLPHGPALSRVRFGFASILLSSRLGKVSGELGMFQGAGSKTNLSCAEAGRGGVVRPPPHPMAAESVEPGWPVARSRGLFRASQGPCQHHPRRAGRGRCHVNKYSGC